MVSQILIGHTKLPIKYEIWQILENKMKYYKKYPNTHRKMRSVTSYGFLEKNPSQTLEMAKAQIKI